ncbi:hypothetical protein [Phenylobacterium aquaticum]|uniref:hypothetical protein n=1 Tax=Phenylobacterium aquaticum TaxID=1763816 RepID=UPI0026F2C474|nr:hypothetical protein [Phenylobacterium aquaticum]
MSDRSLRIIVLNGVLIILAGMILAGFPLAFVVAKQVYGQASPLAIAGDHRAWTMAHLEGLLNGLLVMALAGATRLGAGMAPGREAWLAPCLLVMGWGNLAASILAPILGVRGMAFDAHPANNLVTGIFMAALVASFAAFWGVIRHLLTPGPAERT